MIVGETVTKVADDAAGCTFKSEAHDVTIGRVPFRIYDTAGLNEGDQGRVPHWKAIQTLYKLIRQLDSISLLIYCMRGRVKENARANWTLFNKIICGEKVPIIAVVTGLDDRDDPDEWWRNKQNQGAFRNYKMHPWAVACVVSALGPRNEHLEVYQSSQTKLRGLIMEHHRRWSADSKDSWFSAIYREVYTTGICFLPKNHMEYTAKMRGLIDELKKETNMKQEESEKLDDILIKAETKLQKSGLRSRFKAMTL
jgi:hypothetical protein